MCWEWPVCFGVSLSASPFSLLSVDDKEWCLFLLVEGRRDLLCRQQTFSDDAIKLALVNGTLRDPIPDFRAFRFVLELLAQNEKQRNHTDRRVRVNVVARCDPRSAVLITPQERVRLALPSVAKIDSRSVRVRSPGRCRLFHFSRILHHLRDPVLLHQSLDFLFQVFRTNEGFFGLLNVLDLKLPVLQPLERHV